ncbi:hypothetical protein ATERTT37_003763 [Aspergillus terreus]
MTFEVGPANPNEASLMKRLTGLKKSQPSLRVNIAIGGWTFNDPGPTATVFSDLARSEANQKKFFKSLLSFMSTYGFDGVDIDWEYPAADDRNGRPEDFDNFPKFMANLKNALTSSGGRDELSLTLPTSYWYLQHFDIRSLVKSVDYFNYMSYDLHGKWDRGILLNSELDDIREEKNIQPTLDKDAAVQILTWDRQWATYDDAKTLQLKLDFARTTCLGGVMVWAYTALLEDDGLVDVPSL